MSASEQEQKIAILGAGSWGATLARLLAINGRNISLWTHRPDRVAELTRTRAITAPLQIEIPANVEITADLSQALSNCQIALFCCPAQAMRSVARQSKQVLSTVSAGAATGKSHPSPPPVILVSAAKGIELKTFLRMSEVLHETMVNHPICVLSGPNLAAEILQGAPAATVVAGKDLQVATAVQQALNTPTFRVYTNSDVVGVELGGALKNIMAIAAGVVDGLKLGTNAKSALVTRGLAEMTRLSVAMGAKPSTLAGLAGMGDLVATCYSSLSRNYRFGFRMAEGQTAQNAQDNMGAVVEGVSTCEAVCELSQKLGIELPIATQVQSTVRGTSTPNQAIMRLMSRPLASE